MGRLWTKQRMAEHQEGDGKGMVDVRRFERALDACAHQLCEFDDVAEFTGLAVVTPRFAFLRRYRPLTR